MRRTSVTQATGFANIAADKTTQKPGGTQLREGKKDGWANPSAKPERPKEKMYEANDVVNARQPQPVSRQLSRQQSRLSRITFASRSSAGFSERAASDFQSEDMRGMQSGLFRSGTRDLLLHGVGEAKAGCCRRWVRLNEAICDNWRFTLVTTVLTIYALFGDDFRLAVTHKDVDGIFNILTLVCITVFTVEIVAQCFGRAGYFLGFFFYLDVVSTVTLLLDLTWIGDLLLCGDAEEGSRDEAVRTSRAGRVGARASRTVRIIRLLRLVKVWKAYKAAMDQKAFEAKQARARASRLTRLSKRQEGNSSPGEETNDPEDGGDDEDDHEVDFAAEKKLRASRALDEPEEEAEEEKEENSETRVGKKLSEMTTRRVIILVLVMLFCLPQFTPDTTQVTFTGQSMTSFKPSAHLGISMIYERWRSWCPTNASSHIGLPHCFQEDFARTYTDREMALRWWYEDYLKLFIYNHHSGNMLHTLSWVGIQSKALLRHYEEMEAESQPQTRVARQLGELAQLEQSRYIGHRTVSTSAWDENIIDDGWAKFPLQPLPHETKEKLASPWQEQCMNYFGVPVSTSIYALRPTGCSVDKHLRCSEVDYFYPEARSEEENDNFGMMFAFDKRKATQLEAKLSMLQTIFISLAIGFGSMIFSRLADDMLLKPIQYMIVKMQSIKNNPFESVKLGDLESRREEQEHARKALESSPGSRIWKIMARCQRKPAQPMETVILEKTIIKLSCFLVFSFGLTGAEVISRNIYGDHAVEFDAMVLGRIVDAVIGFCGIRSFTEVLNALQEKVTVFVNLVGEIVHGVVDEYHGATNKNYGDRFVLIWRFSELDDPNDKGKRKRLADMAAMAAIKIVAYVGMSKPLSEYWSHPVLCARIPNFKSIVSIGLHSGTCVECAVGSEIKADPLYLSKNAKVASQLQAATGQYGVHILVSHVLIPILSHHMALLCRLIDHVSIQGSRMPLRIFALDLDCSRTRIIEKIAGRKVIKNRFKLKQLKEVAKANKWADGYGVVDDFFGDEDLADMRSAFTTDFFLRFSTAYRNYEAGQWLAARDMFITCAYCPVREADSYVGVTDQNWPQDGPTVALLSFMKKTQFRPPENWPGYRRLQLAPHVFVDHPFY